MKSILAAAVVAGSVIPALAADLPSRKAPVYIPSPPVFTWTGFYVGANAGGTSSSSNTVTLAAVPVFNAGIANAPGFQSGLENSANRFGNFGSRTGAILGVQAGYNYQFAGAFLIGVEADIQGIIQSGQRVGGIGIGTTGIAGELITSSSIISRRQDFLGTVRARLGYTFTPSFLVYATGGLAYGGVSSRTALFTTSAGAVTPAGATNGINTNRTGYAVGGGLEYMFMPNFSLKAEYLYYDLGSVRYTNGLTTAAPVATPFTVDGLVTRYRVNGHIGRVGVNYHFWGPPAAAVVARY